MLDRRKMRGLVAVLSAVLPLLVLVSADVGHGQTVLDLFDDLKSGGHGRSPAPYDLFVQHSRSDTSHSIVEEAADSAADSAQRSGTEIYLHSELKKLFPGKAVTVTSDRQFGPLRYAAGANERIQMRETKDVESLKQVFFQKPARRREGHGRVADVVTFGGYDIAWKEYDMKAIVATVRLGSLTVRFTCTDTWSTVERWIQLVHSVAYHLGRQQSGTSVHPGMLRVVHDFP